jgi:hypothetical protein
MDPGKIETIFSNSKDLQKILNHLDSPFGPIISLFMSTLARRASQDQYTICPEEIGLQEIKSIQTPETRESYGQKIWRIIFLFHTGKIGAELRTILA